MIRPERTLKDKHYIGTGDNSPVKCRPRRFPSNWEREIERQVSEMMEKLNGICRESNSPWASNVVLVRKLFVLPKIEVGGASFP